MKERKRTLRPLELWNPGAIEKWLEDEAARGWQLTGCGRVLATFTAVEPGAYRVRLRPQQPETSKARRERAGAVGRCAVGGRPGRKPGRLRRHPGGAAVERRMTDVQTAA